MSLTDDKQQNIQIEMDFSSMLTGETERRGGKRLNYPRRRMDANAQPT
jgi:hypothetical protein